MINKKIFLVVFILSIFLIGQTVQVEAVSFLKFFTSATKAAEKKVVTTTETKAVTTTTDKSVVSATEKNVVEKEKSTIEKNKVAGKANEIKVKDMICKKTMCVKWEGDLPSNGEAILIDDGAVNRVLNDRLRIKTLKKPDALQVVRKNGHIVEANPIEIKNSKNALDSAGDQINNYKEISNQLKNQGIKSEVKVVYKETKQLDYSWQHNGPQMGECFMAEAAMAAASGGTMSWTLATCLVDINLVDVYTMAVV